MNVESIKKRMHQLRGEIDSLQAKEDLGYFLNDNMTENKKLKNKLAAYRRLERYIETNKRV